MASDFADSLQALRNLVPFAGKEQPEIRQAFGDATSDFSRFLDKLHEVNASQPDGAQKPLNAIADFFKNAFTTAKTAATSNNALPLDERLKAFEALGITADSVKAKGSELAANFEKLKQNGLQFYEQSQQGEMLAQWTKEYELARANLVPDMLFQSLLKENKPELLYYIPSVQDSLTKQLSADGVQEVASVVSREVSRLSPLVLRGAGQLSGVTSVLEELRTHKIGSDSTQILNHIEQEIESRGVKNLSISKDDLTTLVAQLRAKIVDLNGRPEETQMGQGSVAEEIHKFADEFFKAAEHDGKTKSNFVSRLELNQGLNQYGGQLAVGVASMVAMGVANSWESRIRQQSKAEAMLAETTGEGQPVRAGTVFKQVAATTLGIVGMIALFDASMRGPISQAAQNLITRGR